MLLCLALDRLAGGETERTPPSESATITEAEYLRTLQRAGHWARMAVWDVATNTRMEGRPYKKKTAQEGDLLLGCRGPRANVETRELITVVR